MAFFILPLLSAQDLDIGPRALAQGIISVQGWWQGQYEKGHVLIYLSHILPGQITCYCPRKMPHQRILKYNTSPSLFKQLKIHICMEVIYLLWKYKYKDRIVLNFQIISNIQHVDKSDSISAIFPIYFI